MKTSIFYNTDEVTKLIEEALSNEIKNCPWCGKQPFIHFMYVDTLNEQWVVSCENELCPAQPTVENVYYTKEEAIKAWNTRKG